MDWKWFIRDLASTSSAQIGVRNEDEASRAYAISYIRGLFGDGAAKWAANVLRCDERGLKIELTSGATPAAE